MFLSLSFVLLSIKLVWSFADLTQAPFGWRRQNYGWTGWSLGMATAQSIQSGAILALSAVYSIQGDPAALPGVSGKDYPRDVRISRDSSAA